MKGNFIYTLLFLIIYLKNFFVIIKVITISKKCDLIYFKNVMLLSYKPFNNYVSPILLPNQKIISPLYTVLRFFDIITFHKRKY